MQADNKMRIKDRETEVRLVMEVVFDVNDADNKMRIKDRETETSGSSCDGSCIRRK